MVWSMLLLSVTPERKSLIDPKGLSFICWWNLTILNKQPKESKCEQSSWSPSRKKKSYPCRVGANGAACKYKKCFQAATGWREAKLGVKVYFDVWASTGAWESPRAQGRGVPRGISRGCLIESFLFMIPASPLWIHGAAVQQTNGISQGNRGRKEGFITQSRPEKTTRSPCALDVIQWWKTWGWERRLWGHYKDYKENPAPVLGAAGKIKKEKKKKL